MLYCEDYANCVSVAYICNCYSVYFYILNVSHLSVNEHTYRAIIYTCETTFCQFCYTFFSRGDFMSWRHHLAVFCVIAEELLILPIRNCLINFGKLGFNFLLNIWHISQQKMRGMNISCCLFNFQLYYIYICKLSRMTSLSCMFTIKTILLQDMSQFISEYIKNNWTTLFWNMVDGI